MAGLSKVNDDGKMRKVESLVGARKGRFRAVFVAVALAVGVSVTGFASPASADTMTQHRNSGLGRPRKWICMDIECQAGCGLVPFQYRDRNFVNALQWAIGLELLLLVDDPWRVFLTTDHPNGAPFTTPFIIVNPFRARPLNAMPIKS